MEPLEVLLANKCKEFQIEIARLRAENERLCVLVDEAKTLIQSVHVHLRGRGFDPNDDYWRKDAAKWMDTTAPNREE